MRQRKSLFHSALLLAALLAGCGAPADGPAPTVPTSDTAAAVTTQTAAPADAAPFLCDALFFGDSITTDGDFQDRFPELTVVNLGVYGDTLADLLRRVPQVRAERPARVFLMGGINSLRNTNAADCLAQYETLLDALKDACPEAEIFVQSLLPVSSDIEDLLGCSNETIRSFNAALEEVAAEKGCVYVDVWSAYAAGGQMDPGMTRDGLHLNFNAYGPWADLLRPYLDAEGA